MLYLTLMVKVEKIAITWNGKELTTVDLRQSPPQTREIQINALGPYENITIVRDATEKEIKKAQSVLKS